MRSALELLEDRSFGSLSLREVARGAGVVPTAFYRHFDSTEELGLALVDESFRTLRLMLREARTLRTAEAMIDNSVSVLVRHVHDNRLHFRFVTRERYAGMPVLRHAIRAEIRLLASEVATDLARFPFLNRWSTEDLNMIASLIVNAVVSIAEEILEAPGDSPDAEEEIIRLGKKQLTLVILGVPKWRGSESLEGVAVEPRAGG